MDDTREQILTWLSRVSNPRIFCEFPCENPVRKVDECENFQEKVSRVTCATDDEGKFVGEGVIDYENGDYFEGEIFGTPENRLGILTRLSENGLLTNGTWSDDQLEGYANIQNLNGFTQAYYSKGLRHGFFRSFGLATGREDNLKLVAYYNSGSVVHFGWKGLIGKAYLVGPVDENDDITGDRCFFVYPDLNTVIVGKFRKGQLIQGNLGRIVRVSLENDILIPEVETVPVPEMLTRDESTLRSISKTPLISDFWEEAQVEVKKSQVSPDAGEGLYAKIDLKDGQMVSLFNGVRLSNSKDEDEAAGFSSYKIRLNGQTDLDVPDEYTNLSKYKATLGHKANHSFSNNARWSRIEHARFGLICAITATKDIRRGDEILVNYGLGLADAPEWYKQLWIRHCREEKGMDNDQIKDWCGRQYAMYGKVIELDI